MSTSTARTAHTSGVACQSVFARPHAAVAIKPVNSSRRATTWRRKSLKPMLGHLAIQRRAAEAELLCGLAQVSFVLRDRLLDRLLLERLEIYVCGCHRLVCSRQQRSVATQRLAFCH